MENETEAKKIEKELLEKINSFNDSVYIESKVKNINESLSEKKDRLKDNFNNYEELLDFSALLVVEGEINDFEIQRLKELLDIQDYMVDAYKNCTKKQETNINSLVSLGKVKDQTRDAIKQLEGAIDTYKRKKQSRKAANVLHDLPGGSREKREKIRKAWVSGKYSSRDRCAEEESAALNMSPSTARKALRNTPDPT